MKKSNIKKSIVILIIVIIIIVATVIVVIPAVKTSTLKIKYISGGTNPMNPSESDGVGYGGEILIYIDEYLPNWSGLNPNCIHGTYPADQYITFSGLSIGKHTVEAFRTDRTDLADKHITSHAAIFGDTTVDLHYADGFQ